MSVSDAVDRVRRITAADLMVTAKRMTFESASSLRNEPLMETARNEAHAALDALLDAIEEDRRHRDDELRRLIRGR